MDKTGEMSGERRHWRSHRSHSDLYQGFWEKYTGETRPPTIQEDLTYESMDRNEQVVFVYMYRLATNPNLQNQSVEMGSGYAERKP